MRAILISSGGLALTSLLELAIALLSGSVALLSDALHNLGDVWLDHSVRSRVSG